MNARGITNPMTPPGLAGLPRRTGKKPILAAVNGLCLGGGLEMVANCDVVLAASTAVFGLPEVKRGIVPVAGSMPRLARTLGLQRTMEMVLTGRDVSAEELCRWGLVNRVVSPDEEGGVVEAVLGMARAMCENSPDALIVGRAGVRMAWEEGAVEDAVGRVEEEWYPRLVGGENFREGIEAWVQRRGVRWVDSKL